MRKIALLAFCTVLLSRLFAQTNIDLPYTSQFVYLFHYQPDSASALSKRSEEQALFRNKNYSVYMSRNTYNRDSAMAANPTEVNFAPVFKAYGSYFSYRVIKDDSTGKTRFQDRINRDWYEYNEPDQLNWQILPDTALVNYIPCQKATLFYGGRNWTAWFTNTIPLSEGPYKFKGLPGMIVMIEDSQGYFKFELIAVRDMGGSVPPIPGIPRVLSATKSDFNTRAKNYLEHMFEFMMQYSTITNGHADQAKRNMEERNKKKNNFVER